MSHPSVSLLESRCLLSASHSLLEGEGEALLDAPADLPVEGSFAASPLFTLLGATSVSIFAFALDPTSGHPLSILAKEVSLAAFPVALSASVDSHCASSPWLCSLLATTSVLFAAVSYEMALPLTTSLSVASGLKPTLEWLSTTPADLSDAPSVTPLVPYAQLLWAVFHGFHTATHLGTFYWSSLNSGSVTPSPLSSFFAIVVDHLSIALPDIAVAYHQCLLEANKAADTP